MSIVADSLGGTIVRGYLAYLTKRRAFQPNYETNVDIVITIQGVMQGSYWPLLFMENKRSPYTESIASALEPQMKSVAADGGDKFDSPAGHDIWPQSNWYRTINSIPIPPTIRYYNFYTDMQVQLETASSIYNPGGGGQVIGTPVAAGDLVSPGGQSDRPGGDPDDPRSVSPIGGARFWPKPPIGTAGYGYTNNYEWEFNPTIPQIANAGGLLAAGALLYGEQTNHAHILERWDSIAIRDCNQPTVFVSLSTEIRYILIDNWPSQPDNPLRLPGAYCPTHPVTAQATPLASTGLDLDNGS